MFFRRRTEASQAASSRLFGGRSEESPGSIIGKNTRFRGEVRGSGFLVIRGQVEGLLNLHGKVHVDAGSTLRADVLVPEMILAGSAEGEIRVHERLSVTSSGILQGDVESGTLRVEQGAILRGNLRKMTTDPLPAPPPQSTP